MALKKLFEGLVDFTTEKPAVLRQELQRLVRAIDLGFTRVASTFEPLPTVVLVATEQYKASFFEFVLTDSTTLSIVVELPAITSQDEGKFIEIGRVTASSTVTARAASGQLIQGTPTLSVAGVGYQRFRVARGAWWKQV